MGTQKQTNYFHAAIVIKNTLFISASGDLDSLLGLKGQPKVTRCKITIPVIQQFARYESVHPNIFDLLRLITSEFFNIQVLNTFNPPFANYQQEIMTAYHLLCTVCSNHSIKTYLAKGVLFAVEKRRPNTKKRAESNKIETSRSGTVHRNCLVFM